MWATYWAHTTLVLIPYITFKSIYKFLSPCFKNILSFTRTYIATPTNHYAPPPPPKLHPSCSDYLEVLILLLSALLVGYGCKISTCPPYVRFGKTIYSWIVDILLFLTSCIFILDVDELGVSIYVIVVHLIISFVWISFLPKLVLLWVVLLFGFPLLNWIPLSLIMA